jgi:hypothetical protein
MQGILTFIYKVRDSQHLHSCFLKIILFIAKPDYVCSLKLF